jgi:hypothetical protein
MQNGTAPVAELAKSFEADGVPIEDALIGGFGAVIVLELLQGVLGSGLFGGIGLQTGQLLVKGLASWALANFGPNVGMSKSAATLGAGFIAFDALRQLIPLDDIIKDAMRGVLPTVGVGNNAGEAPAAHMSHVGGYSLSPLLAARNAQFGL